MLSDTEKALADTIDRITDQFYKQNAINKAFFVIINELLKNNASSNMILKKMLTEAEGKVAPESLEIMKDISDRFLTHGVERHQKMTEAMLDAMQGKTEDMEKKLNELFRNKES